LKRRVLSFACLIFFAVTTTCCSRALAASNDFIPVSNARDMVHDQNRDVVYITAGTKVLRYKISGGTFLTPYTFNSGSLSGIDLSPDGNTLAIADRNITGIHLIDLQTDAVQDVNFSPDYGEGGSFTVAYGSDGNILVTTQYNGSGSTPLRLVDPRTGGVSIISKTTGISEVRQNTMLSASGDGSCIAFAESNSSAGPFGIYDVASKSILINRDLTGGTSAYNYEIGTNRDCTQLAIPTYNGTYVYDKSLTKLGAIGAYAAGQPIAAAYNPHSDVVYFAWAGSSEVRAYDTESYLQLASFDVGYTFQGTGNAAFGQGRTKVSRDGSLLFVTVTGGVAMRATSLAPSADGQALFSNGAVPLNITLTASSPQQKTLTYTIVTSPQHGSIAGTPPNVTYTPQDGYSGGDSFTFKANDGTQDSGPAQVTITVDRTTPQITSFTLPDSYSSLTVPITSFSGSDEVGVTGYCTSPNPSATSCTWSSTPATSYRFDSSGDHTLYAFVRDAAGNISTATSASTSIGKIVPQVTNFSIPASYDYDNPTVSVALSATDDVLVTGYCVTEATTSDACSWSSYPPSSYAFATLGPHTLYAFAKNSAGNVSSPAMATTTALGAMNFIAAANRKDMVYDVARGLLYITNGTQVLRYQLATNTFLTPYTFGLGNLHGLDLSPDGDTLAIADVNITGVHLVDLKTGTAMPNITFSTAISGEGGTFSVAYGKDGALLTTSTYLGSGWAPLRRIDPVTRTVTTIKSMISEDAMLSASADRSCIGYVEGNISSGPLSIYDVATRSVTNTVSSDWFTFEVGTNRDCTQFAVPVYGGTFIYDNALTKLGTIGVYAKGQPIAAAYNPQSDVVYFPWAESREVRVYDTTTYTQIGAYDVGYLFSHTGNYPYQEGRIKVAQDGSLFFVTVNGGIRYQRLGTAPVANNQTVPGYQDTALPITLSASSPENKTLTYTIVTPPAHGTLEGAAPDLVYVPEPSYSGTDTIVFKVNDGTSDSENAALAINLRPIPTAVAVADPTARGELTLTWANPAGASSSTIRVYRSQVAGSIGQRVASGIVTTTYTDRGLASKTTYYYTVRVVDASGLESRNTRQVSGTTLDAVAPTTIAISAGGVGTPLQVTLVADEPATVYYSIDGSAPTTASLKYQEPITISTNTKIGYFAVDTAGNVEAVKSQIYWIPREGPAPRTIGDCDLNGTVTIAEVQSAILMFLGSKQVEICVDYDGSNSVTIAKVQAVINSFLGVLVVPGGEGGIPSGSAKVPKYAYAANASTGNVSQYSIDANGRLTPLAPATVSAGTSPNAITVDPAGKYAYVVNAISNDLSQYTIGTDGTLSHMAAATVATGTYPYSITIDPSGRYAYTANALSNNVSQYTISADGSLTAMTPATIETNDPCSVTVDPSGKYAYVTNFKGYISQYLIGAGGGLTPMTPATVSAGTYPVFATIDPSGKHMYVTNAGSHDVSQYTIGADGTLTAMVPATVAAGSTPYAIAIDPSGKFVYVSNLTSNNIAQFTINTDGGLAATTPTFVPAGGSPASITVDPSGKYAYAANEISSTISQYTIGSNGSLTAMTPATIAAGTAPYSIAVVAR